MSAKQHSRYQQKVIQRYYDNLDNIVLTRLQELVTELYLKKDSKEEDRLWERVDKAMEKLKVKPGLREHIMVKRRVEVLAKNLEDWLRAAGKK